MMDFAGTARVEPVDRRWLEGWERAGIRLRGDAEAPAVRGRRLPPGWAGLDSRPGYSLRTYSPEQWKKHGATRT